MQRQRRDRKRLWHVLAAPSDIACKVCGADMLDADPDDYWAMFPLSDSRSYDIYGSHVYEDCGEAMVRKVQES